jgi:hypothetical protein
LEYCFILGYANQGTCIPVVFWNAKTNKSISGAVWNSNGYDWPDGSSEVGFYEPWNEDNIKICRQSFELGVSAYAYCDHVDIGKAELELVMPSGPSVKRTENQMPFQIFGDVGADVYGKLLPVGLYTFRGQVYGRATGTTDPYLPISWMKMEFHFEIVDCPVPFEAPN